MAVLPADYAFTAADAGVHTFSGLRFGTAGPQVVTVTDTATAPVTGQATIAVAGVAVSAGGTVWSDGNGGGPTAGVPFVAGDEPRGRRRAHRHRALCVPRIAWVPAGS